MSTTLLLFVEALVAYGLVGVDLGSLDDNLTLPILSGGCIWGLFKFLAFLSS